MLSLIEFDDLNFLELNPNFIKKVCENRYKDSNYSIMKDGSYYVVYVIKEDLGIFEVMGYHSKKSAINAIESGSLKKELFTQQLYYNEISKVL
jgi:uncharacterized protein YegP (UPF0339 family)